MNPRLERAYLRSPAWAQSLIVSAYGAKLRVERFGRRHEAWNRFLERSETFSAAELTAYQEERLRAVVDTAYRTVPHYRRAMAARRLTPADIRTIADLVKLPVLSREDVRERPLELVAEGLDARRLKASPTSGTTGSPLTVYWNRETDILWNVMLWRHRRWAGVEFGTRYGSLLGRVVVPLASQSPPFWRRNYPWNQVLFSSFHLKPDNVAAYADAMTELGIEALEAYPSTAFIMALGLRSADRTVPLRAVFTSSEPLMDLQREIVEERFRAPVFDYYGMSEAIMFAGECRAHEGLHHHAELSIVEVLGPDDLPVRDGEVGRLVGTTLHNDAMPLIRYEIGDLTTRRAAACSCGRAHPLFEAVTTKAEDIVMTPDGRLVSPSVLTHPLKPLKGLVMSQIIQEARDHLRVLLVLSGSPPRSLLDQVREGMESRLGPGMRVEVSVVDEIPRGKTGKFRWVVSKVPLGDKLAGGRNLYSESGN